MQIFGWCLLRFGVTWTEQGCDSVRQVQFASKLLNFTEIFHVVLQMFIHPSVDADWRRASLHQLNSHVTRQIKGFRENLSALIDCVERSDINHSLHKLYNFVLQLYAVLKKYCKVCVGCDEVLKESCCTCKLECIKEYLSKINLVFMTITKNFYQLVSRRKIYILCRILCKARLTIESYLNWSGYWDNE